MAYLREIDERILASIVRSSDAGTDVGDLMKTYNSRLFTAGQTGETTGLPCGDNYFPRKSHPISKLLLRDGAAYVVVHASCR